MELATGAKPKPEARPIEKAVKAYLEGAAHRLRPRTLATYSTAFDQLVAWAAKTHVENTSDLTAAHLGSLRAYLVSAKKRTSKAHARRGSRKVTPLKRSPVTVNRELRSLKTLLTEWRTAGLLSGLHRDDIVDNLKALPTPREQPAFLTPAALRKLLEAATRHDAQTFRETREEHMGIRPLGSTRRYAPIAPFLAFLLLTGCRRGEALSLRWESIDLDALDHEGRRVGEIRLTAASTKTHRGRTIGLEVSPTLRKLLSGMKLRSGKGYVFGGDAPYTADLVEASRKRLTGTFGAPAFDWQTLRSTCATFLTNAPGIFGAATVFLSAKQLGHSVMVAERHYLGVHRGIPKEANTLDAAMQIEAELAALLAQASNKATSKVPICDVP